MKDCPKCRLANPDSALRCDCGYDFPSGIMKESYLQPKERLLAANPTPNILLAYSGDAVFLPIYTYILYESHWMPKVLSLTVPLALYAAGQIWRWRKNLMTCWRRLT
jgi:hypothetical protein